ncbi:MAG: TrkA family potassium uptake protein [Anaeroplasmataceae bacterium]|nr:TrkA family potassium uptake protein [Anaeroplasmataceae bacterium]MDE5867615.1 TrkA family potassium uptake protein [Anaeroplasmataceae bacterium]
MKKSFIVIGLGRFGAAVARALTNLNCDILGMDISEDCVADVARDVEHVVIADSTKLATLREIGAASIDHAVVAIGNNLEASILTTMNLKTLGVKNITVRSDFKDYNDIYLRLGATEVIVPEEASAFSLANQIASDAILDYYSVDTNYALVKIQVGARFVSRTLIDLDLRNKFDVNIVGIIKNNEFYIPRGTDYLEATDIVVLVGTKQKIRKVDAFINQEAK